MSSINNENKSTDVVKAPDGANNNNNDIQSLFKVCDLDGSGTIDRYELAQICPHLNQNDIDNVFKDLDRNNDGLISFNEFCQGFADLLPSNYNEHNNKEIETNNSILATNEEKNNKILFHSLTNSFKSLSW